MKPITTTDVSGWEQRMTIVLLFFSKAVQVIAISIAVTFGAIAGSVLTTDGAQATLPIMLSLLSAGIGTVPASLLMKRVGRRAGFALGAALGAAGAITAYYALGTGSFAEYCAGFMLLGIYQAFAQYYRFAVTDHIPADRATSAVAFVMAGGVLAALVSSTMADWSQQSIPSLPLQGPFAALGLLLAANALAFALLGSRATQAISKTRNDARRTMSILMDRAFVKATFFTTLSYLIMSCVMTAAPLAIVGCGLSAATAAQAIQWHLVAMFAPSLLLQYRMFRQSPGVTISVGSVAFIMSIVVLAAGQKSEYFLFGMVLLGIGWNFVYVGSTVLLLTGIAREDQATAQGLNELIVWGAAAVASGSSGWIFAMSGWDAVLGIGAVLVVCVLLGLSRLSLSGIHQDQSLKSNR